MALRETLETPDKTAALVTPDRALARRTLAALARWNVAVDDSGGDALADTPAGLFARLAAEAALGALAPVRLLALLKHPLTRLGAAEGAHAGAIAALERALLRGPRPRPGTKGLAQALATFCAELAKLRRQEPSDLHPADPRTSLRDYELDAATGLVGRLAVALAPLEALPRTPRTFAEIAACHRDVVVALSAEQPEKAGAFAGADGKALAGVFDDIALHEADLAVAPADYAELFRIALSDRMVRRPGLPGVRVRIYGALEARLQSVDRMVLGGLVEGTWPPDTRTDPWLNRPMRHALGLDLPERRISLSAHDFAQALGAEEVILSYPAKLAGAPTVTSRFVQRLAAVAGEQRWSDVRRRGEQYLDWARALDRPIEVQRIKKPSPKPPRDARPLALSVTDIESWLRDPYTIYAKYILRLRELDPVDLAPGAADRGIVIHGALREFTTTFAAALPNDPEAALLAIGRKHFAALDDYPEARAFWWPRFERIARWLAGWEVERRAQRHGGDRRGRRQDRDSARRARVHAAHPRRPHRAARRRQLTPFSTTRPGRCRPRNRCASASRRSSRSKPRSCAAAALTASRPAPRWRTSPICRSEAACPRARRSPSISRTATRIVMPTAHSPSSALSRPASRTSSSPTARSCCRCGRTATAPTTTSRA